MFHGIEFRRVGWKSVKLNVLWYDELCGNMGACSIDDHHHEVFRVRIGNLRKEGAECFGVHFLCKHPVKLPARGVDCSVNIGELALVAVVDNGPQGHWGPTTADSHHASKAGFVLKEDFHLSVFDDFGLEDGRQIFREFFFQSSWTLGSLLGCRVSGATLRHPWRASSL